MKRKITEAELQRLNRELRAISNCNQVLIRSMNEQSLLKDICRIICDEAGYRMAWVGFAENDEAQTIRPVAWAGAEDGYLEQALLTWADTERGNGPGGIAIRSKNSACIQDFATDPKGAPWRVMALQRGYRSCIALPLMDEKRNAFGVLIIYSTEPNTFTSSEIDILEEVSGDLAFGIMALRARAEREQAEEKLKAVVYGSPIPQFVLDRDHRVIYWNNALEEISGVRAEEIIGTRQQWRAFYSEERPCMADLLIDGELDAISELYRGK